MPLITRCAHCHTVFRITAEQLQAHGGQVRCGRCMQVFNGLAALSPDVAMATAPVVEPPPAGPTAVVAEQPVATVTPDAAVPAATVEPPPLAEAVIEPLEPLAEQQPAAEPEPAEIDGPMPLHAPEPEPVSAGADDNPFLQDEPAPPAPAAHRVLVATACLLLLLLGLAAQAVYFYRGEIAARHTQARVWLAAACAQFGCTVELPQRPKSLLIEASDLQSSDPARPDRIQLTATLRNHAPHDVAYPALDLVLTNANDHTLARRIFLPHEYLGSGRDPRAGIAANAELTVRIGLETGNLGAAGFRLAVLPAP
ncbi:MAG: DUF3426 domain-containing protein [Burkholderiales bacterium]